jgi:hypothetical protein
MESVRTARSSFVHVPVSLLYNLLIRDIAVGTATGYGLEVLGAGVQVLVGVKFFSFPRHPDWFWDPPSLLSKEYQGIFPCGFMKMTTHLQLVPRSRIRGSIYPLPHTSSWTTLPLPMQFWFVKSQYWEPHIAQSV